MPLFKALPLHCNPRMSGDSSGKWKPNQPGFTPCASYQPENIAKKHLMQLDAGLVRKRGALPAVEG